MDILILWLVCIVFVGIAHIKFKDGKEKGTIFYGSIAIIFLFIGLLKLNDKLIKFFL